MAHTTLKGSCLCGAIQYAVEGEAQSFYHCHCKRCRKTSGSGHNSMVLVTPRTSLSWISGKELLTTFKLPETKRFFACFCSQCGSPMPRVARAFDTVFVPAGTLDTPAPPLSQQRIFWDSRAEWSCADGLPVFAEYPPKE